MSAIDDAAAALTAALRAVDGVRHYAEPDAAAAVDPPATVLGWPALTWEALPYAPTSGRWLVYLVVPVNDRAQSRLFELVPIVTAAIDNVTNAVVIRADPGAFDAGGTPLPCYEIQVDVSL